MGKETTYETVIGLEVHAQLLIRSKIFCGCSTQFGADPNTQTCPVCLGLPGALPVLNRKAVEYAIRMALAVHCQVHTRSIFARKNYFYPDLPKGYQISQYEEPLAENGQVIIMPEEGKRKTIRIKRIHLEEDAGKSVHAEEYVTENESFIDLNRCGVPLIEIVSEPDMRSPFEAYLYLTKLRQLLRWLNICDGNMDEGSLRCDANISHRIQGSRQLGVKTELKNMNSFRGVEKALQFEVERQRKVLESGGKIEQETLLWDEKKGIAVPMREKEEAHDYRYFPDPDLIPLTLDRKWIDTILQSQPEMIEPRKERWMRDYGLPEYDCSVLTEDREIADYFETVVEKVRDPKQASNWVMGEVLRILKEEKIKIGQLKISPIQLVEIIKMVDDGRITRAAGKRVFNEVVLSSLEPRQIVEKLGLVQVSDREEIERIVLDVIQHHPNEVEKYRNGGERLFGFFVGQIMKATQGKADPKLVNEILREKLVGQKNPC
ncbi:Asp-tRNA(Asn)/Glu-tRNA(Gln) amidotransferase subunit GatB [bacterium]|nr:Asp-tRNA(Asn)/Glu-tRNA(Gln) amidotransferase subunit GatB [bacterium]